ncbi:hypothetical protein D6D26_09458 [Aureobasidium pullulans]|nr:hypothetical protein D6D26_09458 [Aureobasidium pullulans]
MLRSYPEHSVALERTKNQRSLVSFEYRFFDDMSQSCGPEHSKAYTVAWIAALPHERAAGEAMFDDEYEDPPADFIQNSGDPNAYSWGKIGKHYVVVAALPSGEYGLAPTAIVAQGLRSSLPHVRIGLLVGIGAAVREILDKEGTTVDQRDIRLGDVVVSSPEGTIGGVVQYDLVKAQTVDGSEVLQRHGSLNSPPLALRTALAKLQASYFKKGSTIIAIIAEAFEKWSEMKDKFYHPGLEGNETNRRTDTYHSRGGISISNEARRSPKIHYGTVASSNTLEKSARHRDAVLMRLAKENINPLCFEMEAAGLMNNFPCLVIRGICDYGDEHKNDHWQNYAAITAAGVAKELLRCVNVQQVQETQGIGNLILKRLDTIHQAVERNREDVSHLKMSADAHRRRHVLDWLCSYDYSTQFENHSARYLHGTGQWFLEDSKFLSWVQADQSSTLICPGGPGCGKTTISALVIDHLRHTSSSQKPVIYFFFDYQRRKEQTADAFVATLLRQLASLSQEVFNAVEKLHNRFRSQSRPSLEILQSVLRSAFQTVTGCFIVIDALDECEPVKRVGCTNMLRGCLSQCVVHLLATTRDDHEVHSLFDGDPTLRIQAHVEDLTLYTTKRADELVPNIRHDVGLIGNVIKGVIDASDGVFLLARLHMSSINDQLTANVASKRDCRNCGYMYHEGPGRDRDSHKSRLNQYKLLNYAAKNWGHHLSDQESLAETERTTTDTVLSFLEDASLTCGCSQAMDKRYEGIQEDQEDMYGVYTGNKAMGIRDISGFHEGMYGVHLTASFGLEHLTMLLIEKQQDADIQDSYGRTPLWWAATNGNAGLVKTLLDTRGVDPNNREPIGRPMTDGRFRLGIGQTPLSKAAENGHKAVVKMLIANHEVDVNAADACGRTPLSYAAKKGHAAIVQILLDTKVVRIDEDKNRFARTPLMYAAEGGHEEVVKVLLATGMDNINSRDLLGRTPLMFAAKDGHEAVVKTLLATKNIDARMKGYRGRTAYDLALLYQKRGSLISRRRCVAALLMAAEADATSKDHNSTPELDNEQGKRKQQSSERENKQTSKKQKLLTDDR